MVEAWSEQRAVVTTVSVAQLSAHPAGVGVETAQVLSSALL